MLLSIVAKANRHDSATEMEYLTAPVPQLGKVRLWAYYTPVHTRSLLELQPNVYSRNPQIDIKSTDFAPKNPRNADQIYTESSNSNDRRALTWLTRQKNERIGRDTKRPAFQERDLVSSCGKLGGLMLRHTYIGRRKIRRETDFGSMYLWIVRVGSYWLYNLKSRL